MITRGLTRIGKARGKGFQRGEIGRGGVDQSGSSQEGERDKKDGDS